MAAKKRAAKQSAKEQPSGGFFDYFNFSESYTSLILGIVVVIIATILLVSFFKNKNLSNIAVPKQEISATKTENPTYVAEQNNTTPSVAPSATVTPQPTITLVPTTTPKPTITVAAKPTATLSPTRTSKVTPVPTSAAQPNQTVQPKIGTVYTVATGDDLWHIAVKAYGDGYKWVEIAKANKLTNPGVITAGTKLALPKVAPTIAQNTMTTPTPVQVQSANKITATTYTIAHGDDLWDIAVRAYGDGYKWVDIARANNLANPNLIHSGNTLTIPR